MVAAAADTPAVVAAADKQLVVVEEAAGRRQAQAERTVVDGCRLSFAAAADTPWSWVPVGGRPWWSAAVGR